MYVYVYGKNVLKEYLGNNQKINNVYLTEGFKDKDILNLIEKNNLNYSYLPKNKIDRLVNGNHQGIILDIDDFKYSSLEDVLSNIKNEYPLLVMLDHLEDPHNLGAIIRTSEALGVDGIIIPNKRSISVNGTVIKTSAGAISNIPIIEVSNLVNTMNILKKKGFWFVGTDMNGEDYSTLDYKMPLCLVIGSEGSGMSNLVRKTCDYIVSIPMKGKVNSLNASVASAIVISNVILNRRSN